MKTILFIFVAIISLNCAGQMILSGTIFQSKESTEIKQQPVKKDSLHVAIKQLKKQNEMLEKFIKELKKEKEKKETVKK